MRTQLAHLLTRAQQLGAARPELQLPELIALLLGTVQATKQLTATLPPASGSSTGSSTGCARTDVARPVGLRQACASTPG